MAVEPRVGFLKGGTPAENIKVWEQNTDLNFNEQVKLGLLDSSERAQIKSGKTTGKQAAFKKTVDNFVRLTSEWNAAVNKAVAANDLSTLPAKDRIDFFSEKMNIPPKKAKDMVWTLPKDVSRKGGWNVENPLSVYDARKTVLTNLINEANTGTRMVELPNIVATGKLGDITVDAAQAILDDKKSKIPRLEKYGDKMVKAFEKYFVNVDFENVPAKDYFNPQRKLLSEVGYKAKGLNIEREKAFKKGTLRPKELASKKGWQYTDYVPPGVLKHGGVNKYWERHPAWTKEMKAMFAALNQPQFQKRLLESKSGWTLADLVEYGKSGTALTRPSNVGERLIQFMGSHASKAGPNAVAKLYMPKKGKLKPVTDFSKVTNYYNTYFKYKGKMYGLDDKYKGVTSIFKEGTKLPEFKEFYDIHRHMADLETREFWPDGKRIINPRTQQPTTFGKLMKDTYYYGSGHTPRKSAFAIDHIKGVAIDPVNNLRILPARINSGAYWAGTKSDELLKKTGYWVDKDLPMDKKINNLMMRERDLSSKVLVFDKEGKHVGRKLETPVKAAAKTLYTRNIPDQAQQLSKWGTISGRAWYKQAEKMNLIPLVNKLVADGAAGGPSCDLAVIKAVRTGNAPGGVIGPDCSAQIKQVLQENPDQLIKEAAEAKVKPGESTGFRNIARQILNKIPKGGRLGAILAGAGAVGAGTYAMMGDAEADTMKYNATTGQFDDAEGEPETQEGILNWIADNPIKSGLAPIPALLGASHFAPKAAARALTSFPALVAPALAAEKLYQYKEGVDPGDLALDPLNAIWAMGWGTSAADKWYRGIDPKTGLAKQMEKRLGLESLKPKNWRDTGKALKNVVMSPRSTGTKMVFPFAGPKAGAGIGSTLLRGTLRLAPFGPIPLALSAGYYGWNKYKDIRDTNSILDSMRERGGITEEDADTLRTIMKQGWLGTTSLGAKILGSEELELGGEMIGLDQQKQVLDRLRTDVDAFQEGDPEQGLEGRRGVRAKERQQEFFNWFSDGGRVGMKAGGMDRRTFLKWLAGIAATATGLIKGKGLTTKAPVAKAIPKAIAKFQGVEGMPAWFPRAVAKIKTHGKLIEMADKHYVGGDIYEMMIPVTRKYLQRSKPGEGEAYISKTEHEKVIMEENPLTGEINLHWTGTDNFGDDAIRQINFKPGEAGYQKFGTDPDHPTAWEYQRVKVEEPEFSYSQPDESQPYREDLEYLDIFNDGDEIVEGLEKMTGGKKMVTKDGTVIDVSAEGKGVDEAFQKKIYKDIEGEEALLPDPEGHMTPEGWSGEGTPEFIEGDVPDWVPKDEWPKKAAGGIIETGEIARRPGAVPPLSGPSPDGIMSLYSNPKQVNVG